MAYREAGDDGLCLIEHLVANADDAPVALRFGRTLAEG